MTEKVEFFMFQNLAGRCRLSQQCAELYCRIWKEPPWCEYFWTPDSVQEMMCQELCRPDALCVLAVKPEPLGIVGFTWGYNVDQEILATTAGSNQLDFVFEEARRVYYIDELGVDPGKRHKGVGRQLTTLLLDHARGQGHRRIVLRTDLRAVPARTLYSHLGFTELDVRDAQHENRTYWLLNL